MNTGDLYTRASRVAVLELSGRRVENAVGYVMRLMDADYRREWPQSAAEWAESILAECRRELWQTGRGYNGYSLPQSEASR